MNKPLVIITGASAGIGAATAKIFSEAGYPLGLFARNKEAMEKLNLPNAICLSADVTDLRALQNAIQLAEEQFGPVDCFINNAGFAKAGDFSELTYAEHLNTVNVNVIGVINGIEIVLPGMRERKTGTIINISSLGDRQPRPTVATYAATKAAVKSLSESLRMANAKYGVRVCNLAPTKVNTPMILSAKLSEHQTIPTEALAKAALWIYEQPQAICVRDMVFAPTYYEP